MKQNRLTNRPPAFSKRSSDPINDSFMLVREIGHLKETYYTVGDVIFRQSHIHKKPLRGAGSRSLCKEFLGSQSDLQQWVARVDRKGAGNNHVGWFLVDKHTGAGSVGCSVLKRPPG